MEQNKVMLDTSIYSAYPRGNEVSLLSVEMLTMQSKQRSANAMEIPVME